MDQALINYIQLLGINKLRSLASEPKRDLKGQIRMTQVYTNY